MAAASRKNIDIEVLRGIAILLVLVEHATILTRSDTSLLRLVERGLFRFWGGVDLFFVVSGFVITLSLRALADSPTREAQAVQIVAFWIRRVFRLFPSAWLWIAIMLALAMIGPDTYFGDRRGNLADALCSFLEVQNIHQFFCNRHQSSCGMMGPMWSLSLEEQFYLVFPFVLISVPRRYVNWCLLALIAVQFPLMRSANSTELSWFVRTDALAWGVLLARWRNGFAYGLCEPVFLNHGLARMFFVAAALVVIVSIGLVGGLPIYIGLVVMACAVLVFAASFDAGYIVRQRWLRDGLAWTGSRSYALYLVNAPIYAVVRMMTMPLEWTNATALLVTAGSWLLMLIVADLNYRWVETPLRETGRAIAGRFVATRLGGRRLAA